MVLEAASSVLEAAASHAAMPWQLIVPALQDVPRFSAKQLCVRDSGAGQIKEVHVTNFMCHSNMKVSFQPHVNFISGPNGSGKSAILQALQYCLGVRAMQTGRSGSNAAYLKKGTDVCTAAVRHFLTVALCGSPHSALWQG
jgi:hypothetical protein